MADPSLAHSAIQSQLAPLIGAPHWYVGYSGGIDSTVLLHLLKQWCDNTAGAPPLSAIHINHALQSESDSWQQHCEHVCLALDIPLVSLRADVRAGSRGLEAAARDARYRLFSAQLLADEILFLAHHADDQVETYFLRLLRGAGVQGLAAIPADRQLGCGRLVRPLLSVPREQLEQYARQRALSWIEDPSNADPAQDRNFLRRQVLPLVAQRWPGYRQTVIRASEHAAHAARQMALAVPTPDIVFNCMGDPGIALSQLSGGGQEPALALRHWLRDRGLPAPDQSALAEFLRQLAEVSPQSKPRLHSSAYTLQRFQQAVYLLPGNSLAALESVDTIRPGKSFDLPGNLGKFQLMPSRGAGIALRATDKPVVCWRRGGERCQPVGRQGSASLKKLLQEAGVPPWWRDCVPLLYLAGELLAVGDLWLCDSSRWQDAAGPGEMLYQPRWERNINPAFD